MRTENVKTDLGTKTIIEKSQPERLQPKIPHGSNKIKRKLNFEKLEKSKIGKEIMQHNSENRRMHLSKKEIPGHFFHQNWHDESMIMKRLTDCEKYFHDVPVFAFNPDIIGYERKELRRVNLAFSHMLHHQVVIYEAFLAMYFRPNNFYCVHLDVKASDLIRKTVERLINCYSNKTTTGKIFLLGKKESLDVR